jgi:hypothetical protein
LKNERVLPEMNAVALISSAHWFRVEASGATFLNPAATFDPPAVNIKEAYGELRLPLLAPDAVTGSWPEKASSRRYSPPSTK